MKAWLEMEVVVVYDYNPGEPMIAYYPGRAGGLPNGDGHPGVPESVEISEVLLNTHNIIDFLNTAQMDDLEQQCLEDAKSRLGELEDQ